MDEVPVDIIEDRIAKKINKKKAKMEAELKKAFGIDLDDPKFNLADYDVPEPRPRKRRLEAKNKCLLKPARGCQGLCLQEVPSASSNLLAWR